MISRNSSIVLGFALSLIALVVLAACQPAKPLPLVAVVPEVSTSLVAVDAEEALAYRWQTMADFYDENDLLTRSVPTLDAGDISAARWMAMAKFYERNGLLNDDAGATTIEAK